MNPKLKFFIILSAINCVLCYGMTYLYMSGNLGVCKFLANADQFSQCHFLGFNVDILAQAYLLIIMVPFGLITVPFVPFMYAGMMFLILWPIYSFVEKKLKKSDNETHK